MSTVDRVTHSESFEYYNPSTGLKGWRKTEMSAALIEGEDPIKEAVVLRDKIFEGFKTMNPELVTMDLSNHQFGMNVIAPSIPSSIDYRAKERVEKMIDDAKEPHELARYFQDAINYGLNEHYYKRLTELIPPPNA